jgi:hypothetical protein
MRGYIIPYQAVYKIKVDYNDRDFYLMHKVGNQNKEGDHITFETNKRV